MESSNPTPNLSITNETKLTQPEERKTLEQLGGISCNVCSGVFDHKKQIDNHFALQHPALPVVYTCILCSRIFFKYKAFHDHCYRHVSGKRVFCEKCHRQFSIEAYKLHMEILHNENTDIKRYKCRRCLKECGSFSELSQHIRHCSPTHECNVCHKTFTHKFKLDRHKQCHSEQRDFKCESCAGRFKTKRSLIVHHKLQHENNNKYKCELCSKIFGTSTKLQFHMNMHTGHRPFRCDHCDSTFAHNSNRMKHMERQHSVRCRHLDLTLIEKINSIGDHHSLDENQSTDRTDQIQVQGFVHTSDESKEFTCLICSLRYKSRLTWLRHIKRNHLKFKYRCNDCAKIITCPKPIEMYDAIPSIDSIKPFI